ncbi:MAG: lysylphosphatidylglycerol synthase transmembrane domain-containing protein [Solirubrobacteraceae bacterium]
MSSMAQGPTEPKQASSGATPYASVPPGPATAGDDMPRMVLTRRRMILFGLFVISAVAFLYFVLPKIVGNGGLRDSWSKLDRGDPWWLALAGLFELLSFLGYIALFRAVFVRGRGLVDWRESYQITMAGLAATRLFAAAGAGGVALTAWALRRSGMEARIVACRMIAFMVLLYGVYVTTLLIDGVALATGLFDAPHPFAITVVPAIFGGGVIVFLLAVSLLPHDSERRLTGWATGRGRAAQLARRVASGPASLASGVRTAISLVRGGQIGVLGAVMWWAFDIAVLWACFHAFPGNPPATAIVVMGYFVGMLGNVLPLPGGVGGVDGAMVGAFAAFGTEFGYALAAVLTYRIFSFWLPTVPGIIAYLQLRKTVSRWNEEQAASPVTSPLA